MKHHRPYQLSVPAQVAPPPLPAGIDAVAVFARRAAMIDAGTHPVIAERLARSAAGHQAMRDRRPQPAIFP